MQNNNNNDNKKSRDIISFKFKKIYLPVLEVKETT